MRRRPSTSTFRLLLSLDHVVHTYLDGNIITIYA